MNHDSNAAIHLYPVLTRSQLDTIAMAKEAVSSLSPSQLSALVLDHASARMTDAECDDLGNRLGRIPHERKRQ